MDSDPDATPFIIAHEFFDALPIHAFQSVPPNPNIGGENTPPTIRTPTGPIPLSKPPAASRTNQWRELVVAPVPSRPSVASINKADSTERSDNPKPEFQLSLAKASTPSSLVLPSLSPRYGNLLSQGGATIEISPEAQSLASDIAQRIGGANAQPIPSGPDTHTNASASTNPQAAPTSKSRPSGAALIIDYGPNSTIPTSSLRGIRSHAHVSPFSSPGLVDLSADVDFQALATAALDGSEGVEVHGPIEQGLWLTRMGIRERGDRIVAKDVSGQAGVEEEEVKKRVKGAIDRLVSGAVKGGMGSVYKVLAIVPERGGRRPLGFARE